ncbi:double-stranded RNA-binding protein 2-like [Iris pallida]|uniref:Double-stranded RNA-binding protein 2-like n=1 Tax=Iris pallida TaxID=29817 RepID=A0AAX6I5V1_IRIPA|nr:double-stranded RNA-binding protein 2-like [Iris pallida]
MYKNQLQELAQRSCFNLPSYACIREGPDHAPRFKATVNFNGEVFESPTFCTTLRQAEHSAAEVALSTLSKRGPSRSLAARVLDETGVYKNLLQETAHRAGLKLPVYTTVRSGPGHTPIFSCTVELAGMSFDGEPAKTKKQAQKNAAMAAWAALKQLPHLGPSSSSSASESECNDEQEQVAVSRLLASLHQSEGNKPSPRSSDRQHVGQRTPVPILRDSNQTSRHSYYPTPCYSWIYPSFSPEAAMYQIWQQAHTSQQQNHLLTVPASPLPPDPRFLPIPQSMFQPAQGQFYQEIGQNSISPIPCRNELTSTTTLPPTYFSDYSLPGPAKSQSISQVTIQEIREEKSQGEGKEWIHTGRSDAGAGPSTPKTINVQSDPLSVSNASSNRGTDIALKGFNAGHESSESNNIQEKQVDSQRKPFECMTASYIWPRPTSPSHAQHPHLFNMTRPVIGAHFLPLVDSSHSRGSRPNAMSATMRTGPGSEVLRPQGSSMAAPVRIRSAATVCSARPRAMNQSTRVPPTNFMAPAVHIRTVVPVCSAPPLRASDSTQKKDQEVDDTTAVNSNFDRLQI